jgi:hypothetical protein
MARILEEDREYKRINPTIKERGKLAEEGYTWVLSSNVSAVAQRGNDLYIRFHNASLYRYPNKGNLFERILAASSKGKWVWRFLRRKNVEYEKVGTLPLDQDIDVSDEEIIERAVGFKVKDVALLTEQEMDVFNQVTVGLINTTINTDILFKGIVTMQTFESYN